MYGMDTIHSTVTALKQLLIMLIHQKRYLIGNGNRHPKILQPRYPFPHSNRRTPQEAAGGIYLKIKRLKLSDGCDLDSRMQPFSRSTYPLC
jgi:hypothetical protein